LDDGRSRPALAATSRKKATDDELLQAIRTVGDGRFYLSDALQNVVMNSYTGRTSGTSTEELTDRELEVFNKIAAGLPTREIAARSHRLSRSSRWTVDIPRTGLLS